MIGRWIGRWLLLALALAAQGIPAAPVPLARQHAEDFDAMWRAIERDYAYLEPSDWARARREWRPKAVRARTRAQFIAALEGALDRLRDDHVTLSERTAQSPRRVPGDTDIRAGFRGGAAVVEAVRTYGDADVAGMRPGHSVTRIGGVPTDRAVRRVLGDRDLDDPAARDWALNHALAGPADGTLEVEVREPHGPRRLEIQRHPQPPPGGPPLVARRIGEDRDLGYIRIKAPLDDARLPGQFDAAIRNLAGTRALILDLREVADAGSHAATRAILGHFTRVEAPWQQRQARTGARATDTVVPREPAYTAPVVVLVDRWTAGEGEALAAGMAAVARARLIGTPMAGLRGELREARLPHTGIVLRYPAQRAFHVDGTPREQLRPHVSVDLAAPAGGPGDPILYQALKLLEK